MSAAAESSSPGKLGRKACSEPVKKLLGQESLTSGQVETEFLERGR